MLFPLRCMCVPDPCLVTTHSLLRMSHTLCSLCSVLLLCQQPGLRRVDLAVYCSKSQAIYFGAMLCGADLACTHLQDATDRGSFGRSVCRIGLQRLSCEGEHGLPSLPALHEPCAPSAGLHFCQKAPF